MAKAVFCISESEAQASEIVNQLKSAGFSNDDISALLPDKTGTKDFGHEHHTKAPEGATMGGIIGVLVFGILGWLAGTGAVAIPGLGPFIAAGPFMAALSGAAIGGISGGVIGALIGLSVPEFEARRFEGKLREGNILISVHCRDHAASRKAKKIFSYAGAYDIAKSTEAPVRNIEPRLAEA